MAYKLVSEEPRVKKVVSPSKRVVVVARGFSLWMMKLFCSGHGSNVVSHQRGMV
jgi:hypothetical protein